MISLWCNIFTLLMRKVRDLILLHQSSPIWPRYWQSATAASQNWVINLWLLIHRHVSFHQTQVSPLWCDFFTSVMIKLWDLFSLQEQCHTWRRYSPNVKLFSSVCFIALTMKWLFQIDLNIFAAAQYKQSEYFMTSDIKLI